MEEKGIIGAVVTGVVLIIALISAIICLEKIPVGYEGVVYNISGGVEDTTLKQGWHIVAPNKKVKLFTVGNEQLLLTKDKREGSKTNESFRVTSSDNATIAISFQMSYRFIPDTLVDTYKAYKGMDGNDIVESRVRTVLKSRVSEVTTSYSLMDLYSGDRAKINDEITKELNNKFNKQFGLEIIDASIIDVHPDTQLKKAINNRIEAQQKAAQARVEQETAKVEAETALLKAKNKAEIEKTEAKGEADANRELSKSITPELIKMKEAEARLKHGWVEVTGSDTTVVKKK